MNKCIQEPINYEAAFERAVGLLDVGRKTKDEAIDMFVADGWDKDQAFLVVVAGSCLLKSRMRASTAMLPLIHHNK